MSAGTASVPSIQAVALRQLHECRHRVRTVDEQQQLNVGDTQFRDAREHDRGFGPVGEHLGPGCPRRA
jgi:hypothetical protein